MEPMSDVRLIAGTLGGERLLECRAHQAPVFVSPMSRDRLARGPENVTDGAVTTVRRTEFSSVM